MNPFRYVFTYFMFPLSYFSWTLFINLVQFILVIALKPISKYWFYKINYYLVYCSEIHLIFLMQWYTNIKMNLYMDKNEIQSLGKEHSYIIVNHSYEIDGICIGLLADNFDCAGNIKFFGKEEAKYIPGFGLLFYFADCIFLKRNYKLDKSIIDKKMIELLNYPDPIWFINFAEGTKFTPKKHQVSLERAKENDLTQYKYHLTPRVNGFLSSLTKLRGNVKYLYDVTLSIDLKVKNQSTFLHLLLGRPVEVNFFIKRYSLDDIPEDEIGASQFLYNLFEKKDKLQESFYKTGDYFRESGEIRVEKHIIKRNCTALIVAIIQISIINLLFFYKLYQVLITGSCYYLSIVSLSCILFGYFLYRIFYTIITPTQVGAKAKN